MIDLMHIDCREIRLEDMRRRAEERLNQESEQQRCVCSAFVVHFFITAIWFYGETRLQAMCERATSRRQPNEVTNVTLLRAKPFKMVHVDGIIQSVSRTP